MGQTKKIRNPWYKKFFKKFYLDIYKDILSSFDTKNQVNFIANILNLSKKSKILDLCGGYGRLSIPLAKKGFEVYLQDLNKDFLKKAEKEAKKYKVEIKIIHSDMRKIPYSNKFDAVINMFTSFGYLENDKEDKKVLATVNKTLKRGGKFLIDVINGEWLMRNYKTKDWRKVDDFLILEDNKFNRKTKRNLVNLTIINFKNHKTFFVHTKVRIYTFSELKNMLLDSGFKIIKSYGTLNKEKFSSKFSKRIVILAKKY